MPLLFFCVDCHMVETPYSEHFDDIYFATEDGLAESRYVFLDHNHLPDGWMGKDRFVIAETGFGTGLNFLSAWDLFEKTTKPQQQLHFYSFEKFPLAAQDIQRYLGHWSADLGGRLEKLVAMYPLRVGGWHTIRMSPQVTLTLIFDDVNRALPQLDGVVDCWFLDGHAPAKNPDMWSETVFQNIGRLSRKGTTCATFTAAGFVRRALRTAGFKVHKTRGFGYKCDMNVAIFDKETDIVSLPSRPDKIAVIGGGIAGASVSAALMARGCKVTLFEKDSLASGGSGNIRGLCNPKFSAQRTADADFYSSAFALAQRTFKHVSAQADIGYIPCGSLHIINDNTKAKRFKGFAESWGWHSDHVGMVNPIEASEICGIALSHEAMFLPDAAMVSPKLVVGYLASAITEIVTSDVSCIERSGDVWCVEGREFDAVILAGGTDVKQFVQTVDLPLQKVRGQITRVRETEAYSRLKTNLCYGGYSSVAFDGQVVIGSTFQHWIDNDALRPEDDADNISKLMAIAPQLAEGLEVIGARAAFRCAAKDRVPVIGQIAGYEGLYVSTAHGSHGILSSLLGAEFLAARICGEPNILPREVEALLSPNRFFRSLF